MKASHYVTIMLSIKPFCVFLFFAKKINKRKNTASFQRGREVSGGLLVVPIKSKRKTHRYHLSSQGECSFAFALFFFPFYICRYLLPPAGKGGESRED